MSTPAVAHPAATVVLLKQGTNGCEVLLVRRSARLSFHGGAWVFPGGRIDSADYAAAASADIVEAARHAAARETREEAGVGVSPECLVLFARWVTPEELPKRFDAWFFAAPADTDRVQVDGDEIHEHCWIPPEEALAAQRAGRLEIPPPTFVTLNHLVGYRTPADALNALARRPCEAFLPRLHLIPEGACSLYAGDVGYETGDLDAPGPRHRLWIVDGGWRYERTPSHGVIPGTATTAGD
jgi:8-oxo-dGTP pyrophosphatase MutT (NUDIX family)